MKKTDKNAINHESKQGQDSLPRRNCFDFHNRDAERPAPRAAFNFRTRDSRSRVRLARGAALVILTIALWPATVFPQSLWHDTSKSMFVDKRAAGIGDIITVLIEENTTASKDNETKTEKQSSLSAAIASFLYPQSAGGFLQYKGQMPAMAYNSDHKHDGTGSISDSENVVAEIAVRIVDVLPNGNFVVEGRRETAFSGEHQTILLHGVVRSDDVQADNTVYSYNVADASIQIIGKGTVTESQRKGWFDRLWDIVAPF
ncbi:MAG TPA: flagellar basal body L-ring protein FlgH [Candidatus Saccharimonadales bacterium]|nr:flagellar basal body L-ring protein FlgH [Candidatus Saccharimonadales bacterium]